MDELRKRKYLRGTTIYEIPVIISMLSLSGVSIFVEKFSLRFQEKYCLIRGPVGSGKTAIIKSIVTFFHEISDVHSLLNNSSHMGKIELETTSHQRKILYIEQNQMLHSFRTSDDKCLLLDDGGVTFFPYSDFLKDITTWKDFDQVIITTSRTDDFVVPPCFQVIELHGG